MKVGAGKTLPVRKNGQSGASLSRSNYRLIAETDLNAMLAKLGKPRRMCAEFAEQSERVVIVRTVKSRRTSLLKVPYESPRIR